MNRWERITDAWAGANRWERLHTEAGTATRKWWAASPERRAAFTRAAQGRGDRRFDDLTREQWATWARDGSLPDDMPDHSQPVPPRSGKTLAGSLADELSASLTAQRAEFLRHCRPATADDYRRWLDGYEARGGQPTHAYDYAFDRAGFYVLTTGPLTVPTLPSLYGATSVNVIVPASAHLYTPDTFHGECGHSHAFRMDEYQAPSWVPTYTDVPGRAGSRCPIRVGHTCQVPPDRHTDAGEAHPIETTDKRSPVRWAYEGTAVDLVDLVGRDLDRGPFWTGRRAYHVVRDGGVRWSATRPVTNAEAERCRRDLDEGLLPDLSLWAAKGEVLPSLPNTSIYAARGGLLADIKASGEAQPGTYQRQGDGTIRRVTPHPDLTEPVVTLPDKPAPGKRVNGVGTVLDGGSTEGRGWIEFETDGGHWWANVADPGAFRVGQRVAVVRDPHGRWTLAPGEPFRRIGGSYADVCPCLDYPPGDLRWRLVEHTDRCPNRRPVVGSYAETLPAAGRIEPGGWPGLGDGWLTNAAHDRWLRHLDEARRARQWVNALCAMVALLCAGLQAVWPIDVTSATLVVAMVSAAAVAYPAGRMFRAYRDARGVRRVGYVPAAGR